ncbi:hypothetical protein, partial [Klebsiella pneumoniae]|uniref:hypothetical protein n=1 Tax=Klebsiella pneumoniae TaxID=573 RepID=UPI003B5BE532
PARGAGEPAAQKRRHHDSEPQEGGGREQTGPKNEKGAKAEGKEQPASDKENGPKHDRRNNKEPETEAENPDNAPGGDEIAQKQIEL